MSPVQIFIYVYGIVVGWILCRSIQGFGMMDDKTMPKFFKKLYGVKK